MHVNLKAAPFFRVKGKQRTYIHTYYTLVKVAEAYPTIAAAGIYL